MSPVPLGRPARSAVVGAPAARRQRLLRASLLRVDRAHEVVDGLQDAAFGRGLRKAARDLEDDLHRHGRNAVDAIVVHHLRRASGLHGHAEGVEGRKEGLPDNALRGRSGGHLVRSVQRDALFVHGASEASGCWVHPGTYGEIVMSSCVFSVQSPKGFEATVQAVTDALKQEGSGC